MCVCTRRLRKALSAMQRSTVSGSWRMDTISRMSASLARTSTASAPLKTHTHLIGSHEQAPTLWIPDFSTRPFLPVPQHTYSLRAPGSTGGKESHCKTRSATHRLHITTQRTWLMRLSQPILLRPAAARIMAAKSFFSSSFFSRVFRFPR